MPNRSLKKNWKLTDEAFTRLLKWLDDGAPTNGRKYLEMRERLVSYFDRKSSVNPDDLADETLDRVARRLTEEKITTDEPAKYCYIVAKFVYLESLRAKENKNIEITDSHPDTTDLFFKDSETAEKRFGCLEKCTAKLELQMRELIMNYYCGDAGEKIEIRRKMAEDLGISSNALTIRAYRIREQLMKCVKNCLAK
ncbi:MAG: hypothetical protein ACK5NT_15060 [Pyrinomonadaceae bacterium]